MRRWKVSLLVTLLTAVALAQTASEWDSHEINAIARKLKCSCGCKLDMSCQMPPQPCPVCKMNKVKMYNMRAQGMSETQILDRFVQEEGKDVLVVPPGIMGVVGPYAALAAGLLLVVFVIRRYLRKQPAVAADIDPAVLDKIEKDLAKLD